MTTASSQMRKTRPTSPHWKPTSKKNLANSKLIIPGEIIFKLYDTYGFPYDLTADMARELGIELDSEGFEREMAAQRERAKAAGKFDAAQNSMSAAKPPLTATKKKAASHKSCNCSAKAPPLPAWKRA